MQENDIRFNRDVFQQIVEIGKILSDSFCNSFYDVCSKLGTKVKESLQEIPIPTVPIVDPKNIEAIIQLDKEYTEALYQAKWFPYAGWNADVEILWKVKAAIDAGKKDSAKLKNKIDRILFSYYTDKEIKIIIKQLNSNSDIPSVYKRIIKQAINAYFRKEYAITTVVLSSLWQTLIYLKCGDTTSGHKDNQSKLYFENLVNQEKLAPQFNNYFSDCVMAQCYGNAEANPDVPMRHANAHGWFNKYPTKKSAINAILLTDFILQANLVTGEKQ